MCSQCTAGGGSCRRTKNAIAAAPKKNPSWSVHAVLRGDAPGQVVLVPGLVHLLGVLVCGVRPLLPVQDGEVVVREEAARVALGPVGRETGWRRLQSTTGRSNYGPTGTEEYPLFLNLNCTQR